MHSVGYKYDGTPMSSQQPVLHNIKKPVLHQEGSERKSVIKTKDYLRHGSRVAIPGQSNGVPVLPKFFTPEELLSMLHDKAQRIGEYMYFSNRPISEWTFNSLIRQTLFERLREYDWKKMMVARSMKSQYAIFSHQQNSNSPNYANFSDEYNKLLNRSPVKIVIVKESKSYNQHRCSNPTPLADGPSTIQQNAESEPQNAPLQDCISIMIRQTGEVIRYPSGWFLSDNDNEMRKKIAEKLMADKKMRYYDVLTKQNNGTWTIYRRRINLPWGYQAEPHEPSSCVLDKLVISNEYGRITWLGPIDITDVDFSDAIVIGTNFVEIYPNNCPEKGKGLNKECQITYFKHPIVEKSKQANKNAESIAYELRAMGGYVSYDPSTGEATFRILPR